MDEVFGNRYRVEEQVGSGGMATVYRGIDAVLKRQVAIKVLHPHLASRDDARRRFNREAQAIARLHHTNIVDVYDYSGQDDDQSYLITEFVLGDTLTQFTLAHGPFLPQAAALIGLAIATALRHAHNQGIIHRDIKPDNLMIGKAGTIKLMDFGIATAVDLEQMTATGAILGSPAHMAPEQIDGADIDSRVDVFAFGTLLYYLVTRKLPFMASNPHALFRKILECRYDPPSRHNAAVGRRFEEIVATCMAREPEDRFSGMAAVEDALRNYLRDHKMSDHPALLKRLLTHPEQFQLEWRPALVQVLCEQGREQAKAGSLALAIDAYNRAMAIDPAATEPKEGLSDLTSRSRRNRRMKIATRALAVVAAVGLLGVGIGQIAANSQSAETERVPASSVRVNVPDAPLPTQLKPLPKKVEPAKKVEPTKPNPAATDPVLDPAVGPTAARVADKAKGANPDQAISPSSKTRKPPRGKRPTRPKKVVGAGPSEVSPPVEKATTVPVVLGSHPPNWALFLDGKKVGVGNRKLDLVVGRRYTLKCEPGKGATCIGCPSEIRVPVVPKVGGVNNFKCRFLGGPGLPRP